MTFATPELFVDGTCGRPLPAGELLQEFRFGQFCPVILIEKESNNEVPVVVGKDLDEDGDKDKSENLRSDRAYPITGKDRIAFADLLEMESATAAEESIAGDRAVDTAIARGELLMASTARAKHQNGGGGDGGGGLGGGGKGDGGGGGKGDGGKGKKTDNPNHLFQEVSEEELYAYSLNPWALTPQGERITFGLTSAQKLQLSQHVSVSLQVGTYWITISVKKAGRPVLDDPSSWSQPPATTTTNGTKQGQSYSPSRLLTPADFRGVVLAVYLEWKQSWTLKGFSRGRLLQSLALAPQEETTIELFTWDRRKKTLEQSSSTETEQSMEDEDKTQDSAEVFRELTKKEEFELKGGASLDLQYSPGPVKIKLGVNADLRDKTNADSVARTTHKAIREGVHKASARVKVARSSKVTETTETGSEQRITRKVRNPNLCHTLNLDYFEILTHYNITTEFNEAGMRFCAMIPNPVAERAFSRLFIRQHEGPLRDALLDRSLGPGFDAVRFLRAREVAVAELAERRRRREKDPLPASPLLNADSESGVSAEESAANSYLANLQASARKLMDEKVLATGLDQALKCIGDPAAAEALKTKKGQPLPADLDAGKKWLAQQLFLRSFSQLAIALGELARADNKPQIREWGPRLEPVMPEAASMPKPSQLNLEPQEVKKGLLQPAMWTPTGPFHVKAVGDWAWWWDEINRVGLLEAEDAGLGAVVEQFAKVYRAFLDAAKNKSGEDQQTKLLQQQQKNQDRLNDEDRLENDFPMRDYALTEERAEILERHLQEHAGHYSFALFLALPPQEQLDHIEQAMAGINTRFGPGFFQPRVVSQIGSMLLVPLNHEVIKGAQRLLAEFKEAIDVPTEVDTVLLPSPGLTIDSRLGRCGGCEEFIEESRRLDLDLRSAQVRQAVAEAERFEKRLNQSPPRLEDPRPPVPQLSVDIQRPAPA